jgi:predicted dienelactone hydrolase
MVQGGTHDAITPPDVECIPPYQALPGPAWLMLIEGAGHFTFSDICDFLDSVGAEIEQLSDGCGDDDIASAEAHALASADAVAFFRWTLSGDETARAFLDPARQQPPSIARFEAK